MNFFEYCDIDISPLRFKLKVKLPKIIRKKKEALSKKEIIEILNLCDNIRLRRICYSEVHFMEQWDQMLGENEIGV